MEGIDGSEDPKTPLQACAKGCLPVPHEGKPPACAAVGGVLQGERGVVFHLRAYGSFLRLVGAKELCFLREKNSQSGQFFVYS